MLNEPLSVHALDQQIVDIRKSAAAGKHDAGCPISFLISLEKPFGKVFLIIPKLRQNGRSSSELTPGVSVTSSTASAL